MASKLFKTAGKAVGAKSSFGTQHKAAARLAKTPKGFPNATQQKAGEKKGYFMP